MHFVPVQIVRWVEDYLSGIVECVLTDTYGRLWSIVDKLPCFTAAALDSQSIYPQPGVVACEIVREWVDPDGRRRCIIDTNRPWGVSAKDGETQFEVFADQLTTDAA